MRLETLPDFDVHFLLASFDGLQGIQWDRSAVSKCHICGIGVGKPQQFDGKYCKIIMETLSDCNWTDRLYYGIISSTLAKIYLAPPMNLKLK